MIEQRKFARQQLEVAFQTFEMLSRYQSPQLLQLTIAVE